MDKRSSLDSMLKTVLSASNIEPSKDIFEEAWQKKNREVIGMRPQRRKAIVKTMVAAVLCMIFSIAVVLAVSPDMRNKTYNALRTIFVLEKVGDTYAVVEKPEDTPIDYWNFGAQRIADKDMANMEKLLGFEYYIPEKIGQDFTRINDPIGRITIYGINLKEAAQLNDTAMKAITDENAYKELDSYDKKRSISGIYEDSNKSKYFLYIEKADEIAKKATDLTTVEELNIEGVQCKLAKKLFVEYHLTNLTYNAVAGDMTKKPIKTRDLYYIIWEYEGNAYRTINAGQYDRASLVNMTTAYIKALKQQ